MYLASFLHARDIRFEQRSVTKLQIYQNLVEAICRHHPLPVCGEELVNLILKRDAESSTAYPSGIAIPHIRMDGFKDTVVAMSFLAEPLDYEGTRVNWVVLIITDKSSSKIYLNMVAALLGLSKDAAVMQSLFSAGDGHAVVRTINDLGVQIKKDLCIADVMIKEPVSILPNALIRELGVLMEERDISMLPVADSEGNYLGEVNILNYLGVGIPNYLMMMDNLNFLLSVEPLEHIFEEQDVKTVKEIMSIDQKTLQPGASIIEAVREMILLKKRYLSVVDKGKLVGIVTAMDIFRKVIKA